jgi:uncharacterized SAM-binding protein YcdF (DUF218 family)
MLALLKSSIQLTNFFVIFFFILVISTYYVSFKKTKWGWYLLIMLFLTVSTRILPATLVSDYEAKTPICNPNKLEQNKTYYLHVLGSGYSLDPKLPPTSQLSKNTLARLIEAMRISQTLPKYKIVSSGHSKLGMESQASVVRRAAISLGIPPENCKILPTPANTAEEIHAFVAKFGITKNVIVVSDAMHLPRALMLYKNAGVMAIGAPTNFQVKQGANDSNNLSFPSMSSVNLMNSYLRERLKYWKDEFFTTNLK